MSGLLTEVRPVSFNEVYGNYSIVKDLKQKVQKKNPPRSYLFIGHYGCGKTTLAGILARAFGATDLGIIERNASNNRGIETVRQDLQNLRVRVVGGGGIKVLIYDECHKLTKDAQECLLKDVENPPDGVYFIFCTTDPARFTEALRSRCMTYHVQPLSRKDSKSFLLNVCMNIPVDAGFLDEKLEKMIIEKSDGVPRDMLKMLEHVKDILDSTENRKVALKQCYKIIKSLVISGEDPEIKEISKLILDFNISSRLRVSKMQLLLTQLRKSCDPEQARRSILGYFTSVMLNHKTDLSLLAYCIELIDIFSKNTYDSGFPAFAGMCLDAVVEEDADEIDDEEDLE